MRLKQQVYSALVVSDALSFNGAITSFLPEVKFSPVVFASSINEAKRIFSERNFDVILINAPLSDDIGLDFAEECIDRSTCAILFLMGEALYSQTHNILSQSGILTLQRPASSKAINQSIDDLCTLRERLRRFDKKIISVESKMQEIRLVNRAKWLLIEKKNMTESEAHRYIEKEAMNNSISKTELSKLLIENLQNAI